MSFLLNLIPRIYLIQIGEWFRPLLGFLFLGDQFLDPITGKKYRYFFSYGYHQKRKSVLSPGSFSLERHRLMQLYLQKETPFFQSEKPLKVLHIAPEQCFVYRFRILSHLDYITLDLESPLADVKADICDLPFEDNRFDVVFCNHVLEHIKDDQKAISEIYRVLKNKGWAILQVPMDYQKEETFEDPTITDKEERIRLFGQYDHLRVYGKDYYQRLSKFGFEVKKWSVQENFSAQEIQLMALDPAEVLPVVFKNNSL
ncbi:MAG: SAM-dependent methyltransferase [Flavobacteriaceae bacterium]|nr:MAG: SAM-dependent methyltransferase [Flavobacteriaceae bacterium]